MIEEPKERKKREAVKKMLSKTHVYSSKHIRQIKIKNSLKK